MVQKDLKEKGYNKEEEYFHELNKKLIEKNQAEKLKKDQEQPKEELPKNHVKTSDS